MLLKKILMAEILLIVSFFPIFLNADTVDSTSTSPQFGMNGLVGTLMIDGITYSQLRLMPEVSIWKFGVGLDLNILIDGDGNIRENDWDDTEDYVSKIYYIRYGHKGEPFYAKIGSFHRVKFANGLIMNNYTNMLLYPDYKQIGLEVDVTTPIYGLGVETFTSNIYRNEILAGRIHAMPLSFLEIPILKDLEIGATIATDRNQYGGFDDNDGDNYPDQFDGFPDDKTKWADTDGDGIPDYDLDKDNNRIYIDSDADNDGLVDSSYAYQNYGNFIADSLDNLGLIDHNVNYKKYFSIDKKDDVLVYGADYRLPLITGKAFSLGHYAEIAKIQDHSYGLIFPGFYSKFLIFDMNLEFRYYNPNFEPNYFDYLYDQQRSTISGDSIITKEETVIKNNKATGWYGAITSHIFNFVDLTIAYENMHGTDYEKGKSIYGTLVVQKTLVPKISVAEAHYSQRRVKKFTHWKTPNSVITAKLGYNLSDTSILVANYKERYEDLNGDGRIAGEDETIKSFGFGIEFRF